MNEDEIRARITELEKEAQGLLLEANVRHGGVLELRRLLDRMTAFAPPPLRAVKDEAPQ